MGLHHTKTKCAAQRFRRRDDAQACADYIRDNLECEYDAKVTYTAWDHVPQRYIVMVYQDGEQLGYARGF